MHFLQWKSMLKIKAWHNYCRPGHRKYWLLITSNWWHRRFCAPINSRLAVGSDEPTFMIISIEGYDHTRDLHLSITTKNDFSVLGAKRQSYVQFSNLTAELSISPAPAKEASALLYKPYTVFYFLSICYRIPQMKPVRSIDHSDMHEQKLCKNTIS